MHGRTASGYVHFPSVKYSLKAKIFQERDVLFCCVLLWLLNFSILSCFHFHHSFPFGKPISHLTRLPPNQLISINLLKASNILDFIRGNSYIWQYVPGMQLSAFGSEHLQTRCLQFEYGLWFGPNSVSSVWIDNELL